MHAYPLSETLLFPLLPIFSDKTSSEPIPDEFFGIRLCRNPQFPKF